MSSEYYTITYDFTPYTRVTSAQIDAELAAIDAAFQMLPDPDDVHQASSNYGTGGGTANAHTVTSKEARTAYEEGMEVKYKVSVTNTGAVTLNVDGLGAKSLVKQDFDDMAAGDLPAGMIVTATYDGTRFLADSLTTAAINPDIINDTTTTSVETWSSSKISSDYSTSASLAAGELDTRYYTETELDAGQLDGRYYTETEIDALIADYSTTASLNAGALDTRYYTEAEIDALIADYSTTAALTAGALDTRYYTETELDAGQLDNRYYTESEVDTLLGSYIETSEIGVSVQAYDADTPTELATVAELEAGTVSDPRSIRPDRAKSILVDSVGKVRLTATGDVAAGATVKVNSDGTMSELGVAYSSGSVGTGATLTETMTHSDCCYDAGENVVVFAYYAGSSIKAAAATVSGTTLSFGTAITLTGTPLSNGQVTIVSLGTGLAAVCFSDSSSDIRLSLISISGTTLVEEDQDIETGSFEHSAVAYDSSASIGLIAGIGSSSATVFVDTFTHTSSTITIETGDSSSGGVGPEAGGLSVVFDSVNSKFVVVFMEDASGDEAMVFINCPVSGTTPDLKTRISSVDLNLVINTSSPVSNGAAAVFDPDRAEVIALGRTAGGDALVRFDASTTSGSVQSADVDVLLTEGFGFTTRPGIAYDETLNKIIIVGPDAFSSDVAVLVALNNTGSSLEYEGSLSIQATATNNGGCSVCYDSDNGQCIVGASDTANDDLTAYAVTPLVETSEADSYFGLADEAVSDGSDGVVTFPGGVNDQQSGLQVGDSYWVDSDGTLTNSDSGYRRVGTALSATTIACG